MTTSTADTSTAAVDISIGSGTAPCPAELSVEISSPITTNVQKAMRILVTNVAPFSRSSAVIGHIQASSADPGMLPSAMLDYCSHETIH